MDGPLWRNKDRFWRGFALLLSISRAHTVCPVWSACNHWICRSLFFFFFHSLFILYLFSKQQQKTISQAVHNLSLFCMLHALKAFVSSMLRTMSKNRFKTAYLGIAEDLDFKIFSNHGGWLKGHFKPFEKQTLKFRQPHWQSLTESRKTPT